MVEVLNFQYNLYLMCFCFYRFGDAKKFQAELDSATHRVQVGIFVSSKKYLTQQVGKCNSQVGSYMICFSKY